MREWKYDTNTEGAVRSALLALLAKKALADITVSELAREAHVSRSTFYEHFGNPADVYDSIVDEFAADLSPMMDQVACTSEMKPKGEPFCMRLRDGGPFAPAIDEDRFLNAFLSQGSNLEGHDLYGILTGAGYTPDQARALCAFQLAGCFTAARTSRESAAGWQETKAAIDRFILGGTAALLAAKR
ncbi:MAG: TetR/AcrR family transcriptional regulator [Eggerthellaceae bacterium]|nr:TetR/AcrR family transcriptional regulator [Eggerthellaceae bacterium]